MASIKRAFASFAIVTLGVMSLAAPAIATASAAPNPISVNGTSVAHDSGTTTYSCPSGGTLSGTQCVTTISTAATPTSGTTTYTCNSGDTLSGTQCTTSSSYAATPNSGGTSYSCPSGGSLSGTTCYTSSSYGATANYTYSYSCPYVGSLSGTECTGSSTYAATSSQVYVAHLFVTSQTGEQDCTYPGGNVGGTYYCGGYQTTYTCPSGGSLSGTTCLTTVDYGPATATVTGTTYSCPSGGSLSGSACYESSSYGATGTSGGTTYTCNSGDTLSGTQCTTSSSYAATATSGGTTYSCPGGGTLSGTQCTTSSSYAATATTTPPGSTTYTATSTATDGTVFTATSTVSQTAAQAAANAEVTAYDSAPPGTTTYTATSTATDGTVFTATSTVSQTAAQAAANALATAHNGSTTVTYTATAIATDGTVFTATSTVSQAAAQTAANAEVTAYDTTNATTIAITPTATNVPRSVPLVATVVVTNAPSNAGGTIVATLMGPVSTSSAGCHSIAPSRFASAGKKSYTAVAAGSGSYSIAAAPSRPGCYAWSATVTYAGGVKASLAASGKSSVFVAAAHLAANRVSIPASGVLVRTVAVATRTQEINQLATASTVAVWNAKALSAKAGTTVIAGHVSSPGSAAGVLSRATQLKAGSLVYATTSTGKVTTWTVTKIQTVSSIPASLFAGGGTHRLVLLTCVGTYNATLGHYTTYVIITTRAG